MTVPRNGTLKTVLVGSGAAVAIFATLWAMSFSNIERVERQTNARCQQLEQGEDRNDAAHQQIIERLARIEALLERDAER